MLLEEAPVDLNLHLHHKDLTIGNMPNVSSESMRSVSVILMHVCSTKLHKASQQPSIATQLSLQHAQDQEKHRAYYVRA